MGSVDNNQEPQRKKIIDIVPNVMVIAVPLTHFGTQKVSILEYTDIAESYEDGLLKQASRYAYIDGIMVELEYEIKDLEDKLKAWKGRTRGEIRNEVAESLGKTKATKDDLDSAMDAHPERLVQEERINSLKRVARRLSGVLTSLAQKRSMLEQLAQHERYGMSNYSTRRVTFPDKDTADQLEYERQKIDYLSQNK